MKITSTYHQLAGILFSAILFPSVASAVSPNKTVLPDEVKVYYSEKVGLSRKAFNGGTEKVVPTNNDYKDSPGCYLFCVSKNAKHSAYPISDKVYTMGQVRVAGHYMNGLCIPKGYGDKDVRKAKEFKELCEKSFPEKCEKESCWADANTSQWFY